MGTAPRSNLAQVPSLSTEAIQLEYSMLEVRWPRGCAGNGRMVETKEEDGLTDSD